MHLRVTTRNPTMPETQDGHVTGARVSGSGAAVPFEGLMRGCGGVGSIRERSLAAAQRPVTSGLTGKSRLRSLLKFRR